MRSDRLDVAEGLLREALTALHDAVGPDAGDDDLVRALRVGAWVEREAQRVGVEAVATLQRRGVFAERGQRPDTALADLLGIERIDARRVVTAAEQVGPRQDLLGQALPATLPATAGAYAAGAGGLRHVEVVAQLMASSTARNLAPELWAAAEEQIAACIGDSTPTQLRTWGTELLTLLDQDGQEPDDRDPEPTSELFLTRNPTGSGGRLKGRFDDPALYDLIATVLDARAAPLTADDTRPLGRRHAEAMAAVFGYVADHGDTDIAPATGGRRPHINVLIGLEDLEARARAACLDFGGVATPAALRLLCCDACVVPVVLGGTGQPLDVGRASRTVPDGLRRAVVARDRGCAHPGCDRPPSWCEVHHIVPWELGGETALCNLVMLCLVHHREIHFSGWSVRVAPDGLPEFFPPSWIDPRRRPRRRPRPQRPGSRPGRRAPTARPGAPTPLSRSRRPRTPARPGAPP